MYYFSSLMQPFLCVILHWVWHYCSFPMLVSAVGWMWNTSSMHFSCTGASQNHFQTLLRWSWQICVKNVICLLQYYRVSVEM